MPSAVAEEESSPECVKQVTSPSSPDKAESMDHLPPAGKVAGSAFPVIHVQVICTNTLMKTSFHYGLNLGL